ncbi:MAG TPA: acetoacetate--CoA ligase [Ktedonobacterales bacterium]|nr:acetoacetate--CoA ligase [Ktedonobacterales bacterium]
MAAIPEGTVLWEPSEALKQQSTMQGFIRWLGEHKRLQISGYADLWEWSTANVEQFWEALWQFFDVRSPAPYTAVLAERTMPGATWFPGARLNYAEQAFRHASDARPAFVHESELRPLSEMSWAELRRQVASVASALRAMGVREGDRVVGYVPNIPEAAVALLATASLGAVWSSCSPDMGSASVVDRFKQIGPKVLFAVDGYRYNGKDFDRRETVRELQAALPTLERLVLVPYLNPTAQASEYANAVPWSEVTSHPEAALDFAQVPFDHPLWVLYSSGTTGLPKPIVQGHGGILLEHIKHLALHINLKPDDRFFWFTTTGWMMWNLLVGGLLVGSTVLLYDGSPAREEMGALWSFAERAQMTYFGASAAYIASCMKAGVEPGTSYDLHRLRGMGSTGSPLPIEGFQWVYEHVKPDLWLGSMSGGTDVCTAFVGATLLLPVRAGEIQCRCLGCAVEAWDEAGQPIVNEVGELVITQPMPSMPIYFWNDGDGRRYRESYFEMYPGVWRHGDWIKITTNGGVVIYGRSDATINRQGIRMGTAELYRVVEDIPDVLDSLVVDLEFLGRPSYMPLFVVLRPGVALDDALTARISEAIRGALSARYVPNAIYQIAEVPRTLSGKKLELPVKKILLGQPAEKVANPDSMANPQTIAYFAELARTLNP